MEAWRGQPFPARKKESGLRHLAEVKEKIERSPRKAVALAKAPADVQNKHQAALIALEQRAIELGQKLESSNNVSPALLTARNLNSWLKSILLDTKSGCFGLILSDVSTVALGRIAPAIGREPSLLTGR